jgi:Cof subfamily protein (haloacid dehalogenase superfamily)
VKLALISDIHGNIFALDAVLADAKRNGADTYIFVGDYIFDMPFSNEVTERIRELQSTSLVYAVLGNKEARLESYIRDDKSTWIYDQMGAAYQTFRELKPSNLEWLKSLPETLSLSLPGERTLLARHIFMPLFPGGTGRQRLRNLFNSSGYFMKEHMQKNFTHEEYLKQAAETLAQTYDTQQFAEYEADIIVSGHTHLQWYAFSGNQLLINPGGCGQPLDGDCRAPYMLLTVTEEAIHIDERRVGYPIDDAIIAARQTEIYRHGSVFLEACFFSMQKGYVYMSELRKTARHIAEEQGESTPVKEPVNNEIWRLAGQEFFAAHGIGMGKNIRLIVTDLDQTLLHSDKSLSTYTADVLNRCREKGVKIVFATARSLSDVTDYLAQINTDGLCLSNGSVIMENDKEIKRFVFENTVQNAIISVLKKDTTVYRISTKSAEHSYYTGVSISACDTYYDFPDDCAEDFSSIAFRSSAPDHILDFIKQVDGVRHYRVTGEELTGILPVDANKWNAIWLLAERWGIKITEIAAFGDDYNDIEMLQNSGIGVAVANAIDEVKNAADYICGSNDDDGVAMWLDENVLY